MSVHAQGAILLVSCYELGHTPHGIAMPAAFLERAGFAPQCLDIAVQPLDADADAAIAKAQLILVSVPMHTAMRLGMALVARIRALNPDCQLAFAGHYAAMNRDRLRALGADHIFAGEYEAALVELAESMDQGTPPRSEHVQLGKLDFAVPARAGLPPLSAYARLIDTSGERHLVGYTETTRGCIDTCRHCPIPVIYGGRFFVVPRAIVLEDIAELVNAGASHITFGDPDFLNGPGHSLAIARELHARWPDLSFDITAQVTHLLRDPAILGELPTLGCAFVVSAFESFEDRVLQALGKRHRRHQIDELLISAREARLELRPTFVAFTPWTELDDLRRMIDLIEEKDLLANVDPVQLAVRLLVPPGSLLLRAPSTASAFGALDPEALSHRWQHTDPRMDALQRSLSARLEQAVDSLSDDESADDTFTALRALIYRACELEVPAAPMRARKRVPRVSEPWFC